MLDIKVNYDRAACSIRLHQKDYIETILKCYNFNYEHTCYTPIITKHNLSSHSLTELHQDADAIKHYMSLVGGLYYVTDLDLILLTIQIN